MAWHLAITISGLLIPISLIYSYYRYKLSYFERRGIPHLPPDILRRQRDTMELLRSAYKRFKGNTPIAGIFLQTTPAVIILDLELIKRVLIDDFSSFADRTDNQSSNKELLYALENAEWQTMRRKLTPCFWSAKMSEIFPAVIRAAKSLVSNSEIVDQSDDGTLDIQGLCTRYASDAFVSCVFGVELSGANDSTQTLRLRMQELVARECQTRFTTNCMMTREHCARCTHAQTSEVPLNLSAQLECMVREAIKLQREGEVKQTCILRILYELLTIEEGECTAAARKDCEQRAVQLLTQSLATLLTGFANSAKILINCLKELACNLQIQRQLRQNIVSVMHTYEHEFSYEAMGHMHYLDQVVAETLRKHPTTEVLIRHALSDYRIANTPLTIERGTCVLVPVKDIHHDPAVYPAPERFDPARFDAVAVMARHACAYLPYDDGPRNCLGKRLSKMLIKVAVVALLRIYQIECGEGVEDNVVIQDEIRLQICKI
ncbi:PREDICTED: probable cytochrome P450 6a14 [Rhagoletis zephyria]|uniref:probable cytochrome P450 6a14 n=1 Tax=Rhagoletis zephyria TaxID=28612 RepID=UPI0008116383|nr:PREDICTED: probable cytochrome P450 6a14 [Rhagoletis zephyria]